jgi:hypothetical protein
LVPNKNLLLSGTGTNRTLFISTNTPAATNLGSAVISIVVSDGSLTTTGAFTVTFRKPAEMPKSRLTVLTNHLGTVSPDLNGRELVVGKSYEILARPEPRRAFAGWSGGVTSAAPRLVFVMQSNLVLSANFTVHDLAGTYQGLFFEADAVRHHSSGFFQALVGKSGGFSGSLMLAGQSHSLAGRFDANGLATQTIQIPGERPVTVSLVLNPQSARDQITGQVSDGQ